MSISSSARFPHKAFWPLLLIAILFLAALWERKSASSGASLREKASLELHAAQESDLPGQIYNRGEGRFIWSMRTKATSAHINPALIEAMEVIRNSQGIAENALSEMNAKNYIPPQLSPVLPQDGATAPRVFASMPDHHGESLDLTGRPLRWQLPENILSAYSLPRPTLFRLPDSTSPDTRYSKALAKLRPAENAVTYRELVRNYARKYHLNPSLVMAIIHSESNFQPRLVSSKSAMGLMQVLPSTANGEISRFLHGRSGQMTFTDLSVPEVNIRYGTAYLHILFNRYFAAIRDPAVKEACVIASYNLGPNRFLKLYGNSNESAIGNINNMTPDEFHKDLPRRLPVQETRFYVEKVRRMKEQYGTFQ